MISFLPASMVSNALAAVLDSSVVGGTLLTIFSKLFAITGSFSFLRCKLSVTCTLAPNKGLIIVGSIVCFSVFLVAENPNPSDLLAADKAPKPVPVDAFAAKDSKPDAFELLIAETAPNPNTGAFDPEPKIGAFFSLSESFGAGDDRLAVGAREKVPSLALERPKDDAAGLEAEDAPKPILPNDELNDD